LQHRFSLMTKRTLGLEYARDLTMNSYSRLLPLALMLLFTASYSCQGQETISLRKIEFVGLKKLTPEQAIQTSGLKVGDSVTRDIIDAAADKLMQSGLFRKLSYRLRSAGADATLTFDVEEASRNLPVVFENFVWFTEDELVRGIRQDVPFFDGTAPEAGTTTDKIAASLQRMLSQKNISGRVEHMPYSDPARKREEILFTVQGVKLRICSLHFPGARAISETDLIKASQDLLKSDYSRKDAGGFANYTLFPLYRHLGYLRAEFQQPSAVVEESPSRCAGGVSLTIPVVEGAVYSWQGAAWSGIEALTIEDLTNALAMKSGEVADGVKIDNGLKAVRKAYGRRGYMAAGVRESIEFDDATHGVTYRFNIAEGARYFMGNLIVNGLPVEEADRLKAKWTLGRNAVFDESYIDTFRQTGLREYMIDFMQRTHRTSGTHFGVEIKPDNREHTVDVIISFT
jgi:outer membrane protein assembly factor BamA